MKKINISIVCVFFLLISQNMNSQNSGSKKKSNVIKDKTPSEKMIHMIGSSTYTDIYCGPIHEQTTTTTDPFGNVVTTNDYSRIVGVSYFTLIYGFRYNLMEMNDDFSFGVSAFPSLGLAFSGTSPATTTQIIPNGYTGVFNLPIMAGISFGAAATQSSTTNVGMFLAAGYEYNNTPLFYAHTEANKDVHTHWLNPCFSLGIKYPSRNQSYGNLHELNLKVGMGLSNQDIKTPNNLGGSNFIFKHSFTFRLSYFIYINA